MPSWLSKRIKNWKEKKAEKKLAKMRKRPEVVIQYHQEMRRKANLGDLDREIEILRRRAREDQRKEKERAKQIMKNMTNEEKEKYLENEQKIKDEKMRIDEEAARQRAVGRQYGGKRKTKKRKKKKRKTKRRRKRRKIKTKKKRRK